MIDVSVSACHVGDCREVLARMPEGSAQTCVTSPPFWGLRDYGVDGQIGLEETPEAFIATMVDVFRAVRRVLADDGTLWINIGDCYAGSGRGGYTGGKSTLQGSTDGQEESRRAQMAPRGSRTNGFASADLRGSQKPAGMHEAVRRAGGVSRVWTKPPPGVKAKDLVGIPWMLAFALRADGWYLRSDIVWSKPNPLPEPVTDRPTKSHEYIFLLSKRPKYFYDADAIRSPLAAKTLTTFDSERRSKGGDARGNVKSDNWSRDVRLRRAKVGSDGEPVGANKRSVWTVSTQPYDGPHFATFPPKLIVPCILAGSRAGDLVVDPFFGSGTTGMVAGSLGRRWIGAEINPEYAELSKDRTRQTGLAL